VSSNFEFSLQEWNPNHFELLPDFLKEKVRQSKEYKAMLQEAPAPAPVKPMAPPMKNEDAYHHAQNQQEYSDELPF
jgi:hypothetical protein